MGAAAKDTQATNRISQRVQRAVTRPATLVGDTLRFCSWSARSVTRASQICCIGHLRDAAGEILADRANATGRSEHQVTSTSAGMRKTGRRFTPTMRTAGSPARAHSTVSAGRFFLLPGSRPAVQSFCFCTPGLLTP